MNHNAYRCFECDQLLADLGKALLHLRAMEGMLRQPDTPQSPQFMDDYRSAERDCKSLRARLVRHLEQHDQLVGVSEPLAREHAAA
jgi:hypothetical protein